MCGIIGCTTGGHTGEASAVPSQAPADSSVQVRVIVPDRVQVNDTVALALEIANVGTDALTLELCCQPVLYDFLVLDSSGALVWSWRATRADTTQTILTLHTIRPNAVLRYQGTWDLRDQRGAPVSPGTYSVLGRIPIAYPVPVESPPEPLTVLP